jgi:pyoverdine/dityrosine biosynthesis protein Dit1
MTVSSHMELWVCGNNYHLIDDCVGTDIDEYQDYQDPIDDPDFIDETV